MLKHWRWLLAGAALFILYFFGISSVGLIGPDEPRYASVAREMAASGDWVTPRLWGAPWFEKPPLEYWGQALAFRLRLGNDLSPRLFNALLGCAFIVFFGWMLAREFGSKAGWTAGLILATSVGWFAESRVAVMDLPLSATFGAAMLCLMHGSRRAILAAGFFLGLAILAKGLVAVVLVLPALWFIRNRWRAATLGAGVCVLTAAPWYLLCYARNGQVFLDEFIVKHHFSRFLSPDLQHVQPWWFFLPVLLGLVFPWTPLLAVLRLDRDPRKHLLFAWFAWGMVFFSISTNKLPGYILPLLPPLAALIGIELAAHPRRKLLVACGLLFFLLPPVMQGLPQALAAGSNSATLGINSLTPVFLALGVAAAAYWGREWAIGVAMTSVVAYAVVNVLPKLETRRPVPACIAEDTHRTRRYLDNYYAGRALPECAVSPHTM